MINATTRRLGAVLAIGACAIGGAAFGQASAPAARAPIRQFDVATIGRLGADMYAQDQSAWHATDLVLSMISDAQKRQLAGWVVTKVEGRDRVRFVRRTATGFEAAYEVSFRPGPSPRLVRPTDPLLSAEELARFTASRTALAAVGPSCGESYNYVVLPDPEGSNWLVWVMAASSKPEVVVGGHYRFTISPDGRQILRRDALSVGCLTMPKASDSGGLMVTGLMSPMPLETHVFISLTNKVPVGVAVIGPSSKPSDPPDIWTVEGDQVRPLPPKADAR